MNRNVWIVTGIVFVIGMIGGISSPPVLFLTIPGFLLFYYGYRIEGEAKFTRIACDITVFVLLGLFWISFDGMVNYFLIQPLVNRIARITTMTFATSIPIICICGTAKTDPTPISSYGYVSEREPQRVLLVPEDEFKREHQLTRETVSVEHYQTRKQTSLDGEGRRTWTLCDNCGRNIAEGDVERLRLGMSVVCSCGHVNIRGVVPEVLGDERRD